MMVPGRTLHRIAARICSARTLERIVEPAIADLQKEYSAGPLAPVRRSWMLIRGYAAIVKVIGICTFKVSAPIDCERQVILRTAAWSAALMILTATLLMVPPLYRFGDDLSGWYAATTLVPQALPLAIPIGVVFGLALGLRGRADINSSKVLLIGALAASAVSFAVLAWAMPAGNQAFREITFQELRARGYKGDVTLQKGYNEMTFSELRGEIARASAAGEQGRVRQSAFSFHLRFSLAAAALALAGVLLAVTVNQRALRMIIAFVLCFTYWMLLFAGDLASRRGYLPVPIGAWLPNLTLTAFAMYIASSRSSPLRGSRIPAQ